MEELLQAMQMLPELVNTINTLKSELSNSRKRWLSISEVAEYLPFKKDTIYKKLDVVFVEGKHFFRKDGKVIMDRLALDEWVLDQENNDIKPIIDRLLVN